MSHRAWIIAFSIAAAAPAAALAAPPPLPISLDVKVVNTPGVTVVNGASQPIPVKAAPTEIPWSVDDVGSCNDRNCFFDFPKVPAGKMLVVKFLSVQARPTGATPAFAELVTSNTEDATIGVRTIFGLTRVGLAGASVVVDTYAANGQLLAFVRTGQSPRVTVLSNTAGGFAFAQATLSGYLIDAP